MRVVLVAAARWPEVRRGAERHHAELADALAAHGDAVTCVLEREQRALSAALRDADVVWASVPSAVDAARGTGVPTVLAVLGCPVARPPRDGGAQATALWDAWASARAALRHAAAAATVVQACSRAAADGVEAVTGVACRVVHPGSRSADAPPRRTPHTGPARLLAAGDLRDGRKRLEVLLRALPAVLDVDPAARLAVAGPPDAVPAALAALPRELAARVGPAVDVLGALGDVALARACRRASVLVHPAVDEAFGLVLVEALAAGTPVVCTSSGGAAEVAGDSGVGVVVPPDAPGELARAALRATDLARSPTTPARCAARARTFSWRHAGPAHRAVLLAARRATQTIASETRQTIASETRQTIASEPNSGCSRTNRTRVST